MDIPNNDVISVFNYAFLGLCSRYEEEEAKNIAGRLFQFYFSFSRADLIIRANDKLSESEILLIHKALKKLKEGKPLQYVIGESEFYGMTLTINESVLIPRPETEELVDWIVANHRAEKKLQVLDIGTGSGCIALSIQKNLNAEVYACDISEKALDVAQLNVKRNNGLVQFLLCDILKNPPPLRNLDIIVSNPPYIPKSDRASMSDHVLDHEPNIALFVNDSDPLVFFRLIGEYGLESIKPGGYLYFEINSDYANETVDLLRKMGYLEVRLKRDISGKERMLQAKKRPA